MQAMARVTGVDYDQDAGEYAAHRRLHAGVCTELVTGAGLGAGSRVVEVGCGTGNYARALADGPGCTLLGLDPSSGMLSHAHRQPEPVCWLQARAEELPLAPAAPTSSFPWTSSITSPARPPFSRRSPGPCDPGDGCAP